MKKFAEFIEILLFSFIMFLFIPEIFTWIFRGTFDISSQDLKDAVFLGILTPSFVYFSRKIKSDVAFVLFVIFVVLVLFQLVHLIKW
jgi:predicted membrane-bound mannosyltransferase